MTNFRPDELEHAKRPPTPEEEAVMKTMPQQVAWGWWRRKRAEELAENHASGNIIEGLEATIQALKDHRL